MGARNCDGSRFATPASRRASASSSVGFGVTLQLPSPAGTAIDGAGTAAVGKVLPAPGVRVGVVFGLNMAGACNAICSAIFCGERFPVSTGNGVAPPASLPFDCTGNRPSGAWRVVIGVEVGVGVVRGAGVGGNGSDAPLFVRGEAMMSDGNATTGVAAIYEAVATASLPTSASVMFALSVLGENRG